MYVHVFYQTEKPSNFWAVHSNFLVSSRVIFTLQFSSPTLKPISNLLHICVAFTRPAVCQKISCKVKLHFGLSSAVLVGGIWAISKSKHVRTHGFILVFWVEFYVLFHRVPIFFFLLLHGLRSLFQTDSVAESISILSLFESLNGQPWWYSFALPISRHPFFRLQCKMHQW